MRLLPQNFKNSLVYAAIGASLAVSANASATTPAQERTIENVNFFLRLMDGVDPDHLGGMLERIENNTIQRFAPEQPVWLINSKTEKILYYQGEPTFRDKAAEQLTDDKGQRFGLKAIEFARKSRGLWMNLELGGSVYAAYCGTLFPYIACSLDPQAQPLPTKREMPVPQPG